MKGNIGVLCRIKNIVFWLYASQPWCPCALTSLENCWGSIERKERSQVSAFSPLLLHPISPCSSSLLSSAAFLLCYWFIAQQISSVNRLGLIWFRCQFLYLLWFYVLEITFFFNSLYLMHIWGCICNHKKWFWI